MSQRRKIGVDFDNTIANYDEVFRFAASKAGLLDRAFVGNKRQIRDAVRRLPNGEISWQRLQGVVYGQLMPRARLFPGFLEFLAQCKDYGSEIFIISHKTEFGHADSEKINLRTAATIWMVKQGIFSAGDGYCSRENVFFESTRAEKVRKIGELECNDFIDDLEEVFLEPDFPIGTRRHLFAGDAAPLPTGPFTAYASWHAIGRAVHS